MTVQEMFGGHAHNYTQSAIHSSKEDLDQMVSWGSVQPQDRVLDIATGSGNVAIAFAPFVKQVVAYDLTQEMLDEVQTNCKNKAMTNITCVQGNAEELPFEDDSFDIVTLRLAMHHFFNPEIAIREIKRVLKPSGRFVFADNFVPDDEVLDFTINKIEKLRDPSHGRCQKLGELKSLFESKGFKIVQTDVGYLTGSDDGRMDFDEWMDRIGTPPENRLELRHLFESASDDLRDAMKIIYLDGKIRLSLKRVTILAQ